MNLIEGFLKDELFIDFGSDVIYGSDQMYDTYPCRSATVQFALMPANGLIQIADRIRKDLGFRPMHPLDEYTDETCDNDGWYDFYIGINDGGGGDSSAGSSGCADSCIEFVVVNADSIDNEETYHIDLDDMERDAVYAGLDEQCRRYLGKGCDELLREARDEMEGIERRGLRDHLSMPEEIAGKHAKETENQPVDETANGIASGTASEGANGSANASDGDGHKKPEDNGRNRI